SVFDVTKGKSHYGVGGGYSHFSGRDASRAFVSGNFTGEGLTDNLHGLSSTEVKSIVEWRDFYIRTYIFVGKLVGRYYDNEGNPTKYLKGVEAKAARGAQLLEKQKKEEAKLACCNSKWSQEEGSEVWCDKGYPRLVQRPLEIALTGKMSKRCACFQEDQLGQAEIQNSNKNVNRVRQISNAATNCKLLCWDVFSSYCVSLEILYQGLVDAELRRSREFLGLALAWNLQIGKDKLKVKGTTLCVHESADITRLSKSRSLSKSMHIHEWSEEVTRDTLDPRSNVSSQTKVLLLKSSLHGVKTDAEFILPNRQLAAIGTSWRTPQSRYGEVSFYPAIGSGQKTCLAIMRTSFMRQDPCRCTRISFHVRLQQHVLQAFLELWCPSMNTLHTAVGEISISLWTFVTLRLACCGEFYDEVVPSSKDLLGDETCKPSVPRSCKYLLLAYHHLPKDSNGVLIFDWIPEDIRDETYVAAFLSCWLCNFVLPHNKVGKTHFPPKLEPIGAQMVKYAGENMARHFEPTEARDLFHRINPSRLLNIHFHHQGPSLVADDAKISNTFKDLFVALRSSYLMLRSERFFVSLSHEGVCGLVGQVQQDFFREEYESHSKTQSVRIGVSPTELTRGDRHMKALEAWSRYLLCAWRSVVLGKAVATVVAHRIRGSCVEQLDTTRSQVISIAAWSRMETDAQFHALDQGRETVDGRTVPVRTRSLNVHATIHLVSMCHGPLLDGHPW
ncbi:UNVERIFIED_CONTAM: Membrane-associated progesterone-binding protein 4, partial [Sesamum radiatum]